MRTEQQTQYFGLQGGLDLVTPAILTQAGRVIAGVNYEPHPRGYQRIDGIERFDGRPSPSAESYWILRFDSADTEVEEDDIVEGATSGATGRALIDGVVESGDYGTGDAAGFLVLMTVSGAFQDGEDINVGASKVAEADGTAGIRGALSDEDDKTWFQAAVEKARDDIETVPGEGPVRGAWLYKGERYAFRDNVGGTAGVMHKATLAGWVAQALGRELRFQNGTAAFEEGETVTGGTSGATATINRVVLQDGDWGDTDAVGKLIIGNVTGGPFQNGETLTGGTSSGSAAADGADAAITLPAGGRYDFKNYNFFGASDREAMYAANGVGRGFEWDGTVMVPIDTGMEDDRPTRVSAHRNHLFFAFRGGSVQHSSIGNPYEWNVITGAGELGIGEEIADMLDSVVGAMAIFGRNKVAALFGTSAADWEMRELANDAGAVPWTAQMIGAPMYLDSRGIRSLETTQAFGDFRIGTVTQAIEPLFLAKRKAGVKAVASLRVRAKDQYRLIWDDGTGITIYFGRRTPEILTFDWGVQPTAACSGKDSNGDEVLLIGAADGMVYQVDVGTSLDGDPVPAFIRLPFNHVGSPTQRKRWHKATVEVDSGPDTLLGLVPEFSYGDPDQPPGQEQTFDVRGGGGFWNEAFWDNFWWSSAVEGVAEAPIDGMGRNISIAVFSNSVYERAHILHGLILHFTYRGLVR